MYRYIASNSAAHPMKYRPNPTSNWIRLSVIVIIYDDFTLIFIEGDVRYNVLLITQILSFQHGRLFLVLTGSNQYKQDFVCTFHTLCFNRLIQYLYFMFIDV